MKTMTISSYLSRKQIRFYVAAVLLVFVSFALTVQFTNSQLSTNAGAPGTSLILSKDAHTDDSGRLVDVDPSFDALFAILLLAITSLSSSFFTARNSLASHQLFFTSASPRAPPYALV